MDNANRQPLVSVIIIFMNAEKFIEEAIESVFGQTYSNWELLLVDDGSTDDSSVIALRYAKEHPERVCYLEHAGHQNQGMSASRNLGIRHAQGDYIGFLDADDVWLPHKLERQTQILNGNPEAGMVYGLSQYWHSWTGRPESARQDYFPSSGIPPDTVVQPPRLLTLLLESKAPTPCPSDILLRRKIVKQVGGFEEGFTGAYQLFEDQAFLAKVYLETPVFVSGEYWDRYRQHADSCVSILNGTGQKYGIGLFFFRWLKKYLCSKGIADARLWRALRDKRSRYRHANLRLTLGRVCSPTKRLRKVLKLIAPQTVLRCLDGWLH